MLTRFVAEVKGGLCVQHALKYHDLLRRTPAIYHTDLQFIVGHSTLECIQNNQSRAFPVLCKK
jgi:hypothetical protein